MRREATSRSAANYLGTFDAAIRLHPQDAKSLYLRGLAKHKIGDAPGGDTDVAAAKNLNRDIEKQL